MKHHIIVYIFVFLFLNACYPVTPNKGTLNPKTDASPTQKEDLNKKTTNTLLNNLTNLIETANAHKEKYIKMEEPSDKYGMTVFQYIRWDSDPKERLSSNTERSIKYRKQVYTILNVAIDTNELKIFSAVTRRLDDPARIFEFFTDLGDILEEVTDHLYPKKDTLDKLDTSDLEKLKNSLEKILSIIEIVSKMSKQLLLDYQNDKNSIKTDFDNLESHVDTFCNQFAEKVKDAEKLKTIILSINKF
ncbi:virulence associated lipoprotein (plasmid) [Borrelia sp. CA_690]|uniref:Blasticidin-S acetyltransferase n=1 Tax=Borrelia maritima TaxID=2761123 RepID=A0A5J6WDY8_9SPIR|nr:virulence associated lipoprotein [Borrelia maritima]QFI15007.1 blasticidin-S acetyltransferase [Borrelia maritima]